MRQEITHRSASCFLYFTKSTTVPILSCGDMRGPMKENCGYILKLDSLQDIQGYVILSRGYLLPHQIITSPILCPHYFIITPKTRKFFFAIFACSFVLIHHKLPAHFVTLLKFGLSSKLSNTEGDEKQRKDTNERPETNNIETRSDASTKLGAAAANTFGRRFQTAWTSSNITVCRTALQRSCKMTRSHHRQLN
jgi:hypothetical protein